MSSKRNAWLKIMARPSDHASSGWMKFKGYPGCRTPYIRCTKRARCFPSSDIISLLQDIVGVTISKAFVSEVARNCDEKVILQIIYTALGSELPVGPAHARVSTATSPLSASIALSTRYSDAVANLNTEMTVDGVCVSSKPNSIRLLIKTSIELA